MSDSERDEKRAQFEAVALPLMTALHSVAMYLTRDPEDAADVVQETYYRAYRTFENFRPGTNARAWLFTILYSVIINRRKKARREVRDVPLEEIEERLRPVDEAVSHDAHSDADISRLDSPEVEAALRGLPEAFRAAVLLVDVQELSYEDAAAVLGCPVGTVGSRLSRGRRLLFDALQDHARRAGYLKPTDS
jgi:RNA polymerase sigma-70 factor, ECF subfamily